MQIAALFDQHVVDRRVLVRRDADEARADHGAGGIRAGVRSRHAGVDDQSTHNSLNAVHLTHLVKKTLRCTIERDLGVGEIELIVGTGIGRAQIAKRPDQCDEARDAEQRDEDEGHGLWPTNGAGRADS